MERLTKRLPSGTAVPSENWIPTTYEATCQELAQRLADYEDAEEQGRLLIVPREIGEIDDWLYAIIYDENFHTYDVSKHPIVDLCFSGTIITDAPLGDPGCEIWTPKDQEEYLVCFSEEDAIKKRQNLL